MRSGRVGAALAIALFMVMAGLVSASSASASEYGCGGAHNEAELRAQNLELCRMTFIIDPGAGNMVSRSALLANAGMYDRLGFDRNFLLWAGERIIPGIHR